jgi:hypothetical protein
MSDDSMVNRRKALARISALALAAYMVPTVLTISEAKASSGSDGGGGDGGGGGDSSGGGDGGGDSSGGGDDSSGGGDDDDHSGKDDDSKKAREAVRSGKAASLGEVMGIVRKKFKGEVVRVRLTGSGKNLTYRIRMIDQQNRLLEIRVNAVSRQILSAKVV